MTVLEQVRKNRIIAIVRGISLDKVVDTCRALKEGGVSMIEVTFNQSSATGNTDTSAAIKLISDTFGNEICVGAGTVMTTEQVDLAADAGAKYMIAPNFDPAVVSQSLKRNTVPLPGVMTPSEAVKAFNAGAPLVKIFPAGTLGANYIKAIKAPISHIPLLAVGGVGLDNMEEFLKAGVVGFGMGSSLVNKKLIESGDFAGLTKLAKQFVAKIEGAK